MNLVTEFHYSDGDVGAYDDIDVTKLWSQFSKANHEASHIVIRPDTEAGQLLSNTLHGAILHRTYEPHVQHRDMVTCILAETNTLRGRNGVVTVLRLSPAAALLVADALLASNPDSGAAKQFTHEVGHRLKERH